MIKPLPISWFYENLPEAQIVEDRFKDVIRKNYLLSGFSSIETPVVERLEILTSKGGDDNEIYWLHRINGEQGDDASLWLRFDLTVPLARYVAQNEWILTFPFKRFQIAKVYRWERPQKWRYREFYQADVDIIWNGKLSLFADVEILSTLFNSLEELKFWDFVININNKKLLSWFLLSLGIEKTAEVISVIDKKDKVRSIVPMLKELKIEEKQINWILDLLKNSKQKTSKEIFDYLNNLWIQNELFIEWLKELEYVYSNLINLWIEEKTLLINPAISRGLNYYTWTVFETFIVWAEKMWSIASGWRYENLASNFTKNNFPWVGWSIWLSRLIAVLNNIWKINSNKKTLTEVMLVNMWDDLLKANLSIVKELRKAWINSELYLDSNAKISKQIKYADNKKIPHVIIVWEDELEKKVVLLKTLATWEQIELNISDITNYLKK